MTGQTNTDTQWYIARDGKQHGPLTDIEMRTFVAHNYLRAADLIWRPGLPEWQAATEAFPAAFAQQQQAPAQAVRPPPQQQTTQPQYPKAPAVDPYPPVDAGEAGAASGTSRNRLVKAAAALAIIGGGAVALANYGSLVGGPQAPVDVVEAPASTGETPAADAPTAPAAEQTVAVAPPEPPSTPAAPVDPAPATAEPTPTPDSQTAALAPTAADPTAPVTPSIEGSQIDARLRKIPAWSLIKQDYPDWYVGHISAAEKMAAEKKPDSEIAMHLAQGLVALRRQNAEKALSASSEKLSRIATAFLDNLKALRVQSVSACYGFISKGEVSPAVVQLMETPETATAFNAHVNAVFEAISEGSKSPIKHDPAVKADYDILIKELGKLGWKEEDLQAFSNPRLLAKREPDRVCSMVQEWFVAHLAVPDKPARDRLLFETLKPVVSG